MKFLRSSILLYVLVIVNKLPAETLENSEATGATNSDVVSSVTWDLGDRCVTMLEVGQSILPSPKSEQPRDQDAGNRRPQNDLKVERLRTTRNRFLFLSGTVFLSSSNPPKTFLRLHGVESSSPLEFWSALDWRLLQNRSLILDDGTKLSFLLILAEFNEDMQHIRAVGKQWHLPPYEPSILSQKPFGYYISRGQLDTLQLRDLNEIHKFYSENFGDLQALFQVRLAAQKKLKAEEVERNRKPPEDLVIPFRVLSPDELPTR
ncbi:MAG: hypothetical protein MUF31_00740 [Akkermansiaceae bacterium]|nr:hypothetical protein [Akkermansiaceae bacterium]